jgi:hypothetical protein
VQQNIDNMFVGKSKSIIFTALNRMGQKDYTYWPSGGAVSGVNDWNAGEPAHITDYNCGAFQLKRLLLILMAKRNCLFCLV